MANPQAEDGHIDIANEIAEALMKVNLSAYESRILWFIFRKTYGWNKKEDWISLSQFSMCTGLDRRLVHRAIKSLSSKKMIVINKDDSNHITYGFQKNWEKWELSSRKMTVIKRDDGVSSKKMTDLSSKEIPTKDKQTKDTLTKDIYPPDFLTFWKSYPKKIGKDAALKAWKKRNGTRPGIDAIIKAIEEQRRSDQWTKDSGQYIPNPATWINQGRWDDEIEKKEQSRWFK